MPGDEVWGLAMVKESDSERNALPLHTCSFPSNAC